jgi:hypothetical protein
VIFDESNHIERVTIQSTDDDDLPNLSTHITPINTHTPTVEWTGDQELPFTPGDGDVGRLSGTDETDRGGETRGSADEESGPADEESGPADEEQGSAEKNRTMTMNHMHRSVMNLWS